MDIFDQQTIDDLFDQIPKQQTNDLQRTDAWFKEREGEFTGSENHKLMGTTRSTSKLDWGEPSKVIDFNETAKKYIFSKAKERQRKKVLKRSIGKNGEYGELAEKLVKKILSKKYKIDEVGFTEFIPGIAGSSPDGLVDKKINLEIKLATGWDTLYSREQLAFDEKHQDFWQVNSEMLSLNVDKTLYVVAEPPEELFDMKITDLSTQIIDCSPIHQKALIHRCMIGDAAIKLFLSGVNIHDAILRACTNYNFEAEIENTPDDPGEYFEDVPF